MCSFKVSHSSTDIASDQHMLQYSHWLTLEADPHAISQQFQGPEFCEYILFYEEDVSVKPCGLSRQKLLYIVTHDSHQHPTKLDYEVKTSGHHSDKNRIRNANLSPFSTLNCMENCSFIIRCCPEGAAL